MEQDQKKVKCPKHHLELTVKYTSLNILGTKHPVVIGECPSCKTKYLSREILSSSGSFSISGQSYEYLNELEKAHPHPFKPISKPSQKKMTVDIEIPPPSVQSKNADTTESKNRHKSNKQEKNTSPKSKAQAKKSRTQNRKAAEMEFLRRQLASGKGKPPHVHKLSYPTDIPKTCSKDGQELFFAARVIIDVGYRGIQTKAWYCTNCKTAYIPAEDHARVRDEVTRADLRLTPNVVSVIPSPTTVSSPDEPINLAIQQNTLYVCKGLIVCKRNAHNVESATGVLLGKKGSVIKINTNYCPQCRKHFISYDEYMRYRAIYGVLLGNIKVTNGSFSSSETELEDESILHICGYSVNQNENLSAATRRNILKYLIDSKVSNKPQIIDYLSYFIRRNGKRKNMEEAVRRWSDDLSWVREYQIDRQRHFEISAIHRNK